MRRNITYLITFSLLSVFLIVNLWLSQSLPMNFFNLVTRQDKNDATLFLKKIKKQSDFSTQLLYFKDLYGENIQSAVFEDEEIRKNEIASLQGILEKNQNSRDALLRLAALFYLEDDTSSSLKYYDRAREIDPQIKIAPFEKLLSH